MYKFGFWMVNFSWNWTILGRHLVVTIWEPDQKLNHLNTGTKKCFVRQKVWMSGSGIVMLTVFYLIFFSRFQLDTATVREIESLDKSYENVSSVMASTTKIPIFTNQIKSPTFELKFLNFTNPTSVKSPTFERKYSYFDGPTVKSPTNENSAKQDGSYKNSK